MTEWLTCRMENDLLSRLTLWITNWVRLKPDTIMVRCLKLIKAAGDCICPSIKALILHPKPNMLRQPGIFPPSAFSLLSRLLRTRLSHRFLILISGSICSGDTKITVLDLCTVFLSIQKISHNKTWRNATCWRGTMHRERKGEERHSRGEPGRRQKGDWRQKGNDWGIVREALWHIPICCTACLPARSLQIFINLAAPSIRLSNRLYVFHTLSSSHCLQLCKLSIIYSAGAQDIYNQLPTLSACQDYSQQLWSIWCSLSENAFLIHTLSLINALLEHEYWFCCATLCSKG